MSRWATLLAAKNTQRAANASRGRRARAAGVSDEALILAGARLRPFVVVRKMATPIRQLEGVRPDGTFRACHDSEAGCDFRGQVGPRALVFEAKGATTASLPLRRHGKSTLTTRQREELTEAHAAGGIAGVLIHVRPAAGDVWVWMPWPAWLAAEASAAADGRASLSVAAMEAAGGVRCPMAGGVADWPATVGGRVP